MDVLRRANAVRNADPISLESLVEDAERLAKWCVVLLVAALVAEVPLAFDRFIPVVQRGGTVISSALVALTVFGELVFSQAATKAQGELLERSRKELAKAKMLLAGRRVDVPMATKLGEVLRDETPAAVMFTFWEGDHEARTFAGDLGVVFKQHGWEVLFRPCGYAGELAYGVRVPLEQHTPNTEVARSVRAALDRASIWYATDAPIPTREHIESSAHGPWAEVHIGPRWPADFG